MAQYKEDCGINAQREPPRKLTEWPPMIFLGEEQQGTFAKESFPKAI